MNNKEAAKMKPIEGVEFTITRADMWPWVKVLWKVLWYGGYRVRLRLNTDHQIFTMEI